MTTCDEIEFGTSGPRKLTPEQWEHFKRGVIRRAQDARAQALRDLAQTLRGLVLALRGLAQTLRGLAQTLRGLAIATLTMLQAVARGGRSMVRLLVARAASMAGHWWNARAARRERRRAIRELGALDDRMLKDIGLGRSEIESVIHDPERLMMRGPAAARRRQCAARVGTGAKSQQGAKRVIAPLIDRSAA